MLTPEERAAALREAAGGRPLGKRRRRQLARQLRAVLEALPAGEGSAKGLKADLAALADDLDPPPAR